MRIPRRGDSDLPSKKTLTLGQDLRPCLWPTGFPLAGLEDLRVQFYRFQSEPTSPFPSSAVKTTTRLEEDGGWLGQPLQSSLLLTRSWYSSVRR
ncbi:hypothetical protein AAHA92_21239 [Salvia divinorum]|uniref:Uncharacterized protein n=1 Tax=Salvia divinorum TaxID=28513 RepID=A0ABD1GJT3_SALDI